MSHETPEAASPDILEHIEKLAADADRLLATTTTLVDNRKSTTRAPQTAAIRPPTNVPEVTPSPGDQRVAPSIATAPAPRAPGEILPQPAIPPVTSKVTELEVKREMPAQRGHLRVAGDAGPSFRLSFTRPQARPPSPLESR